MTITIEGGIEIGGNINIGADSSPPPPGPSGSNGVVGFSEMTSGGSQGAWLEDPTATMITNGFILNANSGFVGLYNGVAITYLTANNLSFFSTYGIGSKTIQWAAGSTYSSPMTIELQTNQSGTPELVFFMNSVTTFPATFIFPVTFS